MDEGNFGASIETYQNLSKTNVNKIINSQMLQIQWTLLISGKHGCILVCHLFWDLKVPGSNLDKDWKCIESITQLLIV